MSAVFTIIKKEFARFFGDKRLLLTTILLPGILIYVIYTCIGTLTESLVQPSAQPVVCVRNMPDSLSAAITPLYDLSVEETDDEKVKESVKSGDVAMLVVFPQDFDEAIAEGTDIPNIRIYYNSADTSSLTAYSTLTALLDGYEESLSNVFDINRGEEQFDFADTQSTTKYIMSMIVPMVLIMLLFSGCIAVVLESIAGEKERGTLATLLVTPVKRTHLAAGKIISLSVISMLSGLSSFLGLILSLPKMLSGAGEVSLAMYGFADYLLLFLVVISTVLVLVSLMSIISAYARTSKEANGLMVPVMVLVMIGAVVSMFVPTGTIGLYFVPILNSAMCISSIMSGAVSVAGFAITVCMNIAVTVLLAIGLAVMFNSEKIMFNS